MTISYGWEERPGGLLISSQRFDRRNLDHLASLGPVLYGTIGAVSRKHGARLNEEGYCNNINAILHGDATADIFYAKWKDCADEICMGAAFGWKTYGFTPDGLLADAEYTEDMALLMGPMRELIYARPANKILPNESLAKCFERKNLQQMRERGIFYRYGEVDRANTAMRRQLDENGAEIGGPDSAVMEFKRLPNNLLDSLPMGARIIPIIKDGKMDFNNFIVQCAEYDSDLRFIVTKGQATIVGQPRTDIRAWQQGEALEKSVTKCFIRSSLLATKIEAEEREWGEPRDTSYPADMLPLFKARPDIAKALYPGGKAIKVANTQTTIKKPLPEVHFQIQNNGELIDAISDIGGQTRYCGERAMTPALQYYGPPLS